MGLLAEMTWGQWFLGFLIICVCLFLMLVILLQRGRGTGLAGAFGGGGSGAFGAKTGDVFTWITVVVAAVFLLLAAVGNFIFEPTEIAIASPPSAESPGGTPGTITLPLEEGIDPEGIKLEMITSDGQVIPVDGGVTTQEVPAGSQPPPEPASAPQDEAPAPQDAGADEEPKDEDPKDPGRR